MGNWGLKISLPGKSVYSTDPRDFSFHSGFGSVKIYSEPPNRTYQTVTVGASSSTTVSIEHGLPFVPMVMLFTEMKPGTGRWYNGGFVLADPTDLSGAINMDGEVVSNTYVDSTYIKIKYINTTGGSLDIKYYYFVFANTG